MSSVRVTTGLRIVGDVIPFDALPRDVLLVRRASDLPRPVNGVIQASSITSVVQGPGVAAQPRNVGVVDIMRLVTGDRFKLSCRNQTNTADILFTNISYAVSD